MQLFSLVLDDDLKAGLKQLSTEDDMSMSKVARKAIREYLVKREIIQKKDKKCLK